MTSLSTNNGPPESSDTDPYAFRFVPGYIPPEAMDKPSQNLAPTSGQAGGLSQAVERGRDPKKLVAELREIAVISKTLHAQHPDLESILTLLKYYAEHDRLKWREPQSPFPAYEQMTTLGKALWLSMLAFCHDDGYATQLSDFDAVIDLFLDEFFPNVHRETERLTEQERAQLKEQLGIGEHLLTHYKTFRTTYADAHRFSNQ